MDAKHPFEFRYRRNFVSTLIHLDAIGSLVAKLGGKRLNLVACDLHNLVPLSYLNQNPNHFFDTCNSGSVYLPLRRGPDAVHTNYPNIKKAIALKF